MYLLIKLVKNKLLVGIVLSFVFGMMLLPAATVLTAPEKNVIDLGVKYATDTGLGSKDIRTTISAIIKVAMSLLGIIALVVILAAGFKWMTAGGNEEKVGEAKKLMIQGVIGLAIIFAAYAISIFVLTQLYKATTGVDYSTDQPLDFPKAL